MTGHRVAIVTDSTADISPELVAARQITVVPLTVNLDGRSYLDGVDITPAEFYARMGTSSGMATTSQPAPGQFADDYRRLLGAHEEVVSLHISSRLSGTFAAAVQGAELVGGDRRCPPAAPAHRAAQTVPASAHSSAPPPNSVRSRPPGRRRRWRPPWRPAATD